MTTSALPFRAGKELEALATRLEGAVDPRRQPGLGRSLRPTRLTLLDGRDKPTAVRHGVCVQGELELGQRRQGEISLPPLDSADKGWYLDAMKEGVSDRCEEVRRGFLRFGSIVQQLEQQIGNDGGSNLKPDGVGRAAMKVADFQVLFDPAEKQFDLPAGLVEIGNGLCRTIEIVGEQLERLAGIDVDGDHPAVLGEGKIG